MNNKAGNLRLYFISILKKTPTIKAGVYIVFGLKFNYKTLETSLQSHSNNSRSSLVKGSTVWESISI